MSGEVIEPLLKGSVITIQVTVLASILAAIVALVAGAARLSRSWLIRTVAGIYIEVFRGTSVLVQLYFAYFVLPLFGLELTPLTAGVLAIGLNSGSYGAEIVRGAVQAVPKGQVEAATVLGMSAWKRFRHVVLPQALVIILPSAGNQLIDLLKLTSLVSLITLADITFEAQALRTTYGDTLQIFSAVLVFYFVLASGIAAGTRALERRVRRGIDAAGTGAVK